MSLKLPPPLPPVTTVVGVLDLEARKAASRARSDTVAAVKRALPARTGRARAGQRGSVRREPTGWLIEVKPSPRVRYPNGVSVAEVTRWLESGTGIHGPRHHRIITRKGGPFRLPSGFRSLTIEGQAAQHIYARVATSEEARTSRTLISGAEDAARAAERVYSQAVA